MVSSHAQAADLVGERSQLRRLRGVEYLAICLIVTISSYVSQGMMQFLDLCMWIPKLPTTSRPGSAQLSAQVAVFDQAPQSSG